MFSELQWDSDKRKCGSQWLAKQRKTLVIMLIWSCGWWMVQLIAPIRAAEIGAKPELVQFFDAMVGVINLAGCLIGIGVLAAQVLALVMKLVKSETRG